MGESLLVRYNNNFIVICTHSTYEWKNEQYELMGLNTNDCDILLVKNPMNFNQIYKKKVLMLFILIVLVLLQ